MKIKYILAGCFALYLKVKAQNTDTIYQQRLVPKTEIKTIFSYYNQDGNHSAVTGGTGTERLDVYATGISITKSFKDYNTISFDGGSDIISSASTDKIDDVVSSASKRDGRTFANLSYQRKIKNKGVSVGVSSGFSIESDYFSLPVSVMLTYKEPTSMRSYDLSLLAFFDDLRWGRLNPEHYKPVKLIYPEELRNIEWFDNYKRKSYNLKLGITQIVNRRLIVGFFPEIAYQKGLLSTPFHRVYFNDEAVKVENLPSDRFKIPIGVNTNYFVGSKLILKTGYSFYWDNFGIRGNAIEMETAYKALPLLTLSPFIRLYNQSASKYFEAYMLHNVNDKFYTSDYDLSKFQSLKTGINLKYKPNNILGKNWLFDEINVRYSFYKRTDSMNAHIISVGFYFETL